MNTGMIIEWITAGATVVAAIAAIGAVRFSRQAAEAARTAAQAAAEQVELQRPRPILVASYSQSLKTDGGPAQGIPFTLRNIGDSPAFDIETGPIETPGELPHLGAASRLEMDRIPYLLAETSTQCNHRLLPPRGVRGVLQGLTQFTEDAARFFSEDATRFSKASGHRSQIGFALYYRALDGRRFSQRYVFMVDFTSLQASVEPIDSLLSSSSPSASTREAGGTEIRP